MYFCFVCVQLYCTFMSIFYFYKIGIDNLFLKEISFSCYLKLFCFVLFWIWSWDIWEFGRMKAATIPIIECHYYDIGLDMCTFHYIYSCFMLVWNLNLGNSYIYNVWYSCYVNFKIMYNIFLDIPFYSYSDIQIWGKRCAILNKILSVNSIGRIF